MEGGARNLGLQGTAARAKAVDERGRGELGERGGGAAGGHRARYHERGSFRGSLPLMVHRTSRGLPPFLRHPTRSTAASGKSKIQQLLNNYL